MFRQITTILLALILTTAFIGCSEPAATTESGESEDTVSQTRESAIPETDVATQPDTLPGSDATAKVVCERFLALLSKNERNLAEQLLTRQAFKATVDAGLELEALGGPGSKVKVGEASYATSRAKVAQVPCTVVEKDGSKQSLLWMMRRGDSGWRIAGLIVETGESQEFLSLENRADVAAIMASQGGSSSEGNIRQVSATDDE
ncbi:ABC transporter substrate-binding protein [Mariniblastus fucicola]|uniref:DUF3828 domain-containing protein n=1 Tax=Mariniblastus fucicola TaxID=980251 RepID=A0A5B9P5B2_9BACT|nr:ABC transporter substrate-binding protein [Mariniblastus fucicola]QEG20689.1 hypothetical protein MFFC18_05390 [Mariniblastus fucicola]